ncbi:MAG TPA: sulfatase-like hydrolase/transferase [Methylomirabilota bacterium]|nr:sulfatase-like hydrolase/transferase [Methylomirabilota bacterium]
MRADAGSVTGVLCLATFVLAVTPPATEAGARPNFLIILSDDQRHDTLDYMPRTKARIFGEGVTFSRAYITTSLCCPSRASILTGMYAHKHGVRSNSIPLQKETFIERLKRSGYYTGQVGKYLNSWDGTARPEFDVWAAGPSGIAHYFDPRVNLNGTWTGLRGYLTHIQRDHALEFLQRAGQQDKPFVLLFSPNAPHFGYERPGGPPRGPMDKAFFLRPPEPAPGDEKLHEALPAHRPPSFNRADVATRPRWFRSLPPLTPDLIGEIDAFRVRQLQSLNALDHAVENLLASLAARGKLDDTVVLYLSDNGHFWGEHGIPWGKNAPYEESSRVPFGVRYPRLASKPRVETRLVANIDIAPTIYELAGIPIPADVDGRSLVPLLDARRVQAPSAPAWRDELLLEGWVGSAAAAAGWAPYAAIHTGRYVYVETEGDRSELYDLATDPHQLVNQVANPAYASFVIDLKARLRRLRPAATGSPPR